MPISDYKCSKNHVTEEIFKELPEFIVCACGLVAKRQLGLLAKTPGRWGDCTGRYGVNGHYDVGLGASYSNSMQREAIMKEKGLISYSDLGNEWAIEENIEKRKREDRATDAYLDTFDKVLSEGASLTKAHDIATITRDTTI